MSRARRRAAARAAVALSVVVGLAAQLVLIGTAAAERSGPPPTPVPPRGSPSPFPQVAGDTVRRGRGAEVDAAAVILAELDDGQLMFAKAPEVRRPIASLTKMMTALIVLERRELDDVVAVSPAAVFDGDDYGASSTLGLRPGERRTVRELLDALMLQSANDAALALAIDISGSEQRFLELMNERARALGMRATRFFSPNGLDDRGRSTARDLLVLTRAAYAEAGFARIVSSKFRTISGAAGSAASGAEPQRDAVAVRGGDRREDGLHHRGRVLPDRHRRARGTPAGRDRARRPRRGFLRGGRPAGSRLRGASGGPTFVRAGEAIGTVAIRGGARGRSGERAVTALVPTPQLDRVQERVGSSRRGGVPAGGGGAGRHVQGHDPGRRWAPVRSSSPAGAAPAGRGRRPVVGRGRPTRSDGRCGDALEGLVGLG